MIPKRASPPSGAEISPFLKDFRTDLIVYLRTTPEVAFQRMLNRSRQEECKISFDYIKDLHELHEDWLVRKTKFQVGDERCGCKTGEILTNIPP